MSRDINFPEICCYIAYAHGVRCRSFWFPKLNTYLACSIYHDSWMLTWFSYSILISSSDSQIHCLHFTLSHPHFLVCPEDKLYLLQECEVCLESRSFHSIQHIFFIHKCIRHPAMGQFLFASPVCCSEWSDIYARLSRMKHSVLAFDLK